MLDFLKRIPEGAGDGTPLMVLLHGRGSDMNDLQGLRQSLPREVALVTPRAPHPGAPWGYGFGWAWYRYLGDDRPDAQSLQTSLQALDDFLAPLPDHLGFQPGPMVLGGFSQGGTTSLAYALSRPGAAHGIVNLSGFLPEVPGMGLSLEVLKETPLFWAHGNQDPAVPFGLARKGWKTIQEAGGRLEAKEYAMGHWVSPEEMEALGAWLKREIPDWPTG